ncbi:hypothetical protein [Leekyejoonella antrihumi]|uniref:Uncharacterized protein n=1 Tax=Leekyejoonella antrihumi TaxID=1660198 RepID=A0A563E437_9MICO|nr:hypothetical protein [Leekyejoonella antrihumi]TWP37287.1 hypothetical protein FGL98_05880 [Leekyejoonella antrihumi]
MGDNSGVAGRAIVQVAALERGQADDLVTAINVGRTTFTVMLPGDRLLRLPYDISADELFAALSSIVAGLAAEVPTPDHFPSEPLTCHQKWTELLDDIGGWHQMLNGVSPGLRLASIRRTDAVADITVTDDHRRTTTTIPLDDGHLVVGLNDDIATRFGTLSGHT